MPRQPTTITEFKIDKMVPLLETRGTKTVYPWDDMTPGDSFLLPKGKFRQAVRQSAKKRGLNVTIRKEGNNHRVWLIGPKG